jgi:hypothetical protein
MKVQERAVQIYQVLIAAAHHRQTLTYEIVAAKVGVHRVGLGYFLDAITKYCIKNRYPLLTVLVVQKGSGKPSAADKFQCDIDKERERVFRFEWYRLPLVKVEDMK